MNFSKIKQSFNYYRQFVPVRINFVLLLLLVYMCYYGITHSKLETSSYYSLSMLMAKMAFLFLFLIVSISLLSCLISSLYFKFGSNAKQMDIDMDVNKGKKQSLLIKTSLPKAIKPFLGFVKMRLICNHHQMTDKMIIARRMKKQWVPFATGLFGYNELELPNIKEYHFSKSIFYFEDMLQLFSFAVPSDVNHHLLNTPKSILQDVDEVAPKKTETQDIRIEQLRKVEGEYLNYKKFEDSDDVRRIVWKIFAKNKELVVRIPENLDPFASHVYFYASFFHDIKHVMFDVYNEAMLNRYKNSVWTLYEALSKKGFQVKYIADQDVHANYATIDPTQLSIALSGWQHDTSLSDYFKSSKASVLCIHSFTSASDLKEVLETCDQTTILFFVKLSKTFASYYLLSWIGRIFLRPPQDNMQRLKTRWSIHPFKFKTLQLEKKILNELKKSDVNFEVI